MTRLAAVLTTVVFSLFVSAVLAADWTEFRGPTGQGHSTEKGLPIHWSATENVTWKVPIPGKGWSSPIYLEGRIYLTTSVPKGIGDPNDQSLQALCLDAKTGKTLWTMHVFDQKGSQTENIHRKNSHASPTPITDGKFLFVHFGTSGTACLTLDGKIVWKNQSLKYVPRHGNGGSPILVDDLLVVACDGADIDYVVALDRKTGKIRWKTDRTVAIARKFSFSTPLLIEVDGKQQIVCPGTGGVAAYEPKTGEQIWRVDYGDGYSVIPRPVFGDGLVFVCSGYNTPSLLAINPDGRGDVTESHTKWKSNSGIPHTPSLLLVGQELYLVSDRGIASCVDAITGKVHWKERLGGAFSASPTYADGKIYLQSEQGEAIVIKPGKKFVELARNKLEPRTFASYAVADSALFIRTEHQLYRIEEQ